MKAHVIKLDDKRLTVVTKHGHRFILKLKSLGALPFSAAMAQAERAGPDGCEVDFDPPDESA
jgi:hypothetical protein